MNRAWWIVGGGLLGAAGMYLLDPERGRRRRARFRGRVVHGVRSTGHRLDVLSRRCGHHWQGFLVRRMPPLAAEGVSDTVLAERVRSQIGHVSRHAHSIDVAVRNGCVTLSGPVSGGEVRRLLARASRIPGVAGVENELEVYEQPLTAPEKARSPL